ARKAPLVEKVLEEELRPVAGVPGLLRTLDTRRCVASSSAVPRIRQSLTATGLAAFFEPHLFSAGMVANGKPAPDLFEYAAASMDTDAAECVVVEDSRYGVNAGRAAGMHVIGFTAGAHCGPGLAAELLEAGAHEVASDASELRLALTRTPS
ncbi:MAG: HAD family hydrolase, partial [Burkholderiales bacterium]